MMWCVFLYFYFFRFSECRKWSFSIWKAYRSSRALYCRNIKQCRIASFRSCLFLQSCCCTPSFRPNNRCYCWLQPIHCPWWKLHEGLSFKKWYFLSVLKECFSHKEKIFFTIDICCFITIYYIKKRKECLRLWNCRITLHASKFTIKEKYLSRDLV